MGGGGNPTQTTTTTPSAQQQELFNLALPGVTSYAASPPPQAKVAPFNPTQTAAQSTLLGAADTTGGISNWATGGAEALPGTIAGNTGTPFVAAPSVSQSSDIFNDPGIWNPAYNAGTTAAIDAAQRPTWQALTDTALPAIRGGAITAGGYGGSRGGIAEGVATGRATQTAADQAAKIVEDLYGANLGAVNSRYATNLGASEAERQADTSAQTARYGTDASRATANINALLATYGLAPTLQQEALVPGQVQAAVGDAQQQQQQAVLNANYLNKYAPFLQSKDILSLIGGLPGGTVSATGNSPTPNPISGALGGAATGAALGAVGGPPGMLIGAGIGAGAGTLPFLFH